MMQPHFFDAESVEWGNHPTLDGIRIKALETSNSHPFASLSLVEVAVGGVIQEHMHEKGTETAYVISGQGILFWNNEQEYLSTGSGVTVPAGLTHSLENTGEIPLILLAVHIPPIR